MWSFHSLRMNGRIIFFSSDWKGHKLTIFQQSKSEVKPSEKGLKYFFLHNCRNLTVCLLKQRLTLRIIRCIKTAIILSALTLNGSLAFRKLFSVHKVLSLQAVIFLGLTEFDILQSTSISAVILSVCYCEARNLGNVNSTFFMKHVLLRLRIQSRVMFIINLNSLTKIYCIYKSSYYVFFFQFYYAVYIVTLFAINGQPKDP